MRSIDKHIEKTERPEVLDADLVRFNKGNQDWVAFVGKNKYGKPVEIFAGKAESQKEDGDYVIPKSIQSGKIYRVVDDGGKRYDFTYKKKRAGHDDNKLYKTTESHISERFDKEFNDISISLSHSLRYMPHMEVAKMARNMGASESARELSNGMAGVIESYFPVFSVDAPFKQKEQFYEGPVSKFSLDLESLSSRKANMVFHKEEEKELERA
ncbi:MAG: hypothetical protein PF542_04355 [Nanoarchaeota archaeon]|jgi:hypothetical protein|nr:hypothetical protein [Nanoarchaeota archaeon]